MNSVEGSRLTGVELIRLLETDPAVRVIDVRTGGEFESAHIPGSYNVPLADLDEHGATIAALDEDVVLVCQSGMRASKAEAALGRLGLMNVHVLEGGIAAWERDGHTLRRAESTRWSLERQVRLLAGLIVAASIALSAVVPAAKWVAGFVGAGLMVAALTNSCAMGLMLARLPYNRSHSCDVDQMVAQLQQGATARG